MSRTCCAILACRHESQSRTQTPMVAAWRHWEVMNRPAKNYTPAGQGGAGIEHGGVYRQAYRHPTAMAEQETFGGMMIHVFVLYVPREENASAGQDAPAL